MRRREREIGGVRVAVVVVVAVVGAVGVAVGAGAARADSCMDEADFTFGLGVGAHHRAATATTSSAVAVDSVASLLAVHVRTRCHVAFGARVSIQTDLGDEWVSGSSHGIVDLSPQITFGERAGRWFAHASAGPAIYGVDRSDAGRMRGVGLGADATAGLTVTEGFELGVGVATTLEPERPAVGALLMLIASE